MYVSSQYIQLIRMTKKIGKSYNVNKLTYLDFSALIADLELNFS